VHNTRAEYGAMMQCIDRAEQTARPGSAVAVAARLMRGDELRRQGSYDEAVRLQQRALRDAEQVGNRRLQATAAMSLARSHLMLGQLDAAEMLCPGALERFEELDDPQGRWQVRRFLGRIAVQRGDHAAARRHLRQAELQARALGSLRGRGSVLLSLGDLDRYDGELDHAAACYSRAAELFERCGAVSSRAYAEHNLGLVALERRQLHPAREAFSAAEQVARRLEERPLLADVLVGKAATALGLGHTSEADRLLHEAQQLYEATRVVDVDSAHVAELAADVAEERGEVERAAVLRRMAAQHRA
jgi:tetratricopeptide (TPR) repeat protein